jgi:hypothetical protein
MSIYDILVKKPHNKHYLNRYIKFIESRKQAFIGEKHHICPKASDLFPEYKSFKKNPWNKIILSPREHYIAHMLLHKAYGNSQSRAFYMMCNVNGIGGRLYESARSQFKDWIHLNNPMNNESSRNKCAQFGSSNGMFGKSSPMLGKIGSDNPNYGKKRPEHSIRMSGSNNPSFGVSPKKIQCIHCDKEVDFRNHSKWHGDKCKLKRTE